MSSRNTAPQTNLLDNTTNSDEWTQNKKHQSRDKSNNFNNIISTKRRGSCDMTNNIYSNTNHNKHKIGYISEPDGYGKNRYKQYAGQGTTHDVVSSSEISDFLAHSETLKNSPQKPFIEYSQTALTDHYIEIKRKEEKNKNKNKNNTHSISYIGIGHDPQLQTNSEVFAIKKNENILCHKNIGLTIEKFTNQLETQPKYLHLTFHGEYDTNTNTSIVKFDCIPILPALLTSNETFLYKNRTQKYYRDYIAAIARIFEEELITFVSQPRNEVTNEPLSNIYTCISTEGIFEQVPKLRHLLRNISERRFQCPAVNYRNRKFIGIWYGKWRQDASTGNQTMTQPPNLYLLDEYRLSHICRNRQIDAVVRLIEKRYERIAANNTNFMNINKNCQMYSWMIMNHAIREVIPNEVWVWLNNKKLTELSSDINDSQLYDCFSRTFELTVRPILEDNTNKNKKLKARQTVSEQKILEQKVVAIIEEIIKNIKQDQMALAGVEYVSPSLRALKLLNYKIFRFTNETAIDCVRTKIIAKIQRKYKGKYDISFNALSSASSPSYWLCGYVPLNDQKDYILDMQTGNDEISTIIREKLISRQQCKIKLLLLLGCHSYKLAQIFAPYIECIICVHPETEIDDNICVKFSKYFYNELAEIANINIKNTKFKYTVMTAYTNALNKLRKSYGKNTACQFHENNMDQKNINSSTTLMVVRIDRDKHNELMQYVNHRLMDDESFNVNQIQNTNEEIISNNILKHKPPIQKRSSRGGPTHMELMQNNETEIYDANNNRKTLSLDSLTLQQCLDPSLDEYNDSATMDVWDTKSKYGMQWEYIETKGNLNFSYSIIKCNNEEIKLKIEEILKDKKHQETVAMNRKFVNTKNIYPNKSTFLTETEDDVNYVDLRWDITAVPKCNCIMTIPHRIEDELILLINGKHIDRNMKLPNDVYKIHVRSSSMPENIYIGGYDNKENENENENEISTEIKEIKIHKIQFSTTDSIQSTLHGQHLSNEYDNDTVELDSVSAELDEKNEFILIKSRGGGNQINTKTVKFNKFDDDEKEDEKGNNSASNLANINIKKSYDAAPLYRVKDNIKIDKEFSTSIVNIIKENIKVNEMYGYIDKMTAIINIYNNKYENNNENIKIIKI